jgi:hypothetical protein
MRTTGIVDPIFAAPRPKKRDAEASPDGGKMRIVAKSDAGVSSRRPLRTTIRLE